MTNLAIQDENIQLFVINVSLIDPITEIINGIENSKYRDCDIKWLTNKMDAFIEFAAKTLGISINMPSRDKKADFNTLNSYVLVYFRDRFTTLLNYFKSLL